MSAIAFASAFDAIDPRQRDLREAVTIHAVDALAALRAGLDTKEGAAIARFYASAGSDDEAGRVTQAAGVAAVIRFTECDDIHVASCMTPGAVAVPVALSFAPDIERFTAAIEAGIATGIALGSAVGGAAALVRGVWPTLLGAPAVAAATAAVARGLERNATAQALVLALAGASGRGGRPAGMPSGRWFALGEATLKGIRAALAARAGFSGDVDLISPAWLERQTEPQLARPDHLKGLPRDATASVGIKPFVAARQGMNAIEAFRRVLKNGVDPDRIDRIQVMLPVVAKDIASRPLDLTDRLSTIANLGLQLGLAAFEPDRLYDIGREAAFDPRALALADRVDVAGDEQLDDGLSGSWPARVIVVTNDARIEESCERIPGDLGDGDAAKVVAGKIDRLCRPDAARHLHHILTGMLAGSDNALADASQFLNSSLDPSTPSAHANSPSIREMRHVG